MKPDPEAYRGYLTPWVYQIIQGHLDGESPREIAERLGRHVRSADGYPPTRNAVAYVLERVGFNQPSARPGKPRLEAVWNLRQEGKTLAEIGRHFSLSRERVRQLLLQWHQHADGKARRAALHERTTAAISEIFPAWSDEGVKPPRHRPLDMGGPRDRWLEKSPWDAV